MRIPGHPKSPKGWYDLVDREGWEFVEVAGRGGKTGTRREFKPSAEVMALIEQHQRGELPTPPAGNPIRRNQTGHGKSYALPDIDQAALQQFVSENRPPAPPTEIDGDLLWKCLDACYQVYDPQFMKELPQNQLDYAVDFYNLLVRIAAAKGGDHLEAMKSFNRLDAEEMGDQLQLYLQMRWVKPYRIDKPTEGTEGYSW